MPLLKDESLQRTIPLYWQFNRAKGQAKVAIRDGKWKLLASTTQTGPYTGADLTQLEMEAIKNFGLKDFELYDL